MIALYIALPIIVIAVVLVLRALSRSKPIPDSPPMRTASQRQIERETAGIQRNGDEGWWKNPALAVGAVAACALIAALVVPK